jgi:hypothetical protein|tara:strand:+ start:1996 stop:2637 length:642 start_codon:yes stop_codon:yes gene_type:complete
MTGRAHAIFGAVVLVLGLGLALTVNAYAGATAEAKLLGAQLDTALVVVATLEGEREAAVAVTDSVLAAADSVIAFSALAVAEAQTATNQAVADSETAMSRVRALAVGDTVIQAAMDSVDAGHQAERDAWQEERAVTAVAAFAFKQQIGSMEVAFARERTTWATEVDGLREALSLSQQESAAWQRAASPGALKQIWQQGRAAVVVGTLVLVLTR